MHACMHTYIRGAKIGPADQATAGPIFLIIFTVATDL